MKPFPIQKIVIEPDARDYPMTSRVLANLPDVPHSVEQPRSAPAENADLKQRIADGKQTLLLKVNKGDFVVECPCTPGMIGCNYYIINPGMNCGLDCAYCYLQAYMNADYTTVFVNTDNLLTQLDAFLARHPESYFRFGTGEFTDSFLYDEITGLNSELIGYFSRQERAVLELKTKVTGIDYIYNLPHKENTLLGWSLNPEPVIASSEPRTPNLTERLQAAAKAQQAGYWTCFHFDPIFHYDGWENDYRDTVRRLFESVNPQKTGWISLGTFRYFAGLKSVIQERFPQYKLIYGEHVQCNDGKFRYFQALRIEMYRMMLSEIRKYSDDLFVYLCMESPDVWEQVFEGAVTSTIELDRQLIRSVFGPSTDHRPFITVNAETGI